MVDSTQQDMAIDGDHRSPSLAAFARLGIDSEESGRHDASEAARVAAAILQDARAIRSQMGDLPASGDDVGMHHRLQERLHAAERSALAAQRNGVEALTARLRDDHEGFHEISAAAFGALETSATALEEAGLLADELEQSKTSIPANVDLSADDVTIDLTGEVATVDVTSQDQIEDAAVVFPDAAANLGGPRASIVDALLESPLVGGDAVRRAASGDAESSDTTHADLTEVVVEAEVEADSLGFVVEPPPGVPEVGLSLVDDAQVDNARSKRRSPEEISAEAQLLIATMQPDKSDRTPRRWAALFRPNRDLRSHRRALSKSDQKARKARRKAEFKFERDLIKDSQRELKASGVDLFHRPAWIGQLAFSVGAAVLIALALVGLWFIVSAA